MTNDSMISPVAPRQPVRIEAHGEVRIDDYAWMRQKDDPAVRAYLEEENAYTGSVMAPLKPLEERLYGELLSRIKEDDETVPYRDGGWYYLSKTEQGKQYPVIFRRRGAPDAPDETVLDINRLAEGKPFMAVGALAVSDDGRYLAYSTDETGFRQYTLQVKDLETGELLPDRVERTISVCWAADNRTLFYTVEDEAKRPARMYRHVLGADPANDVLVFEERDEMFRVLCWRSRSKAYVFMGSASHTATELRFLAADTPEGEWRLVAERSPEHEYDIGHGGEWFYIRTNDRGRNFRVVRAPVADPSPANWEEVLAHRDGAMVEDVDVFARYLVVTGRDDGLPFFEVLRLEDGDWHRIAFDEPAFDAGPAQNREFDSGVLRYRYESPVTPPSVYDYDMESRGHTLLKQLEVPGGYDPSQYVVERLHVPAADGVEVPVTVIRRGDRTADGTGAALLQGYGSYGFPYPVRFTSGRVSLLDRGAVVVLAHIRGGGELGKTWHDAGKMASKMNTFTDFISVADALVERGWCAREGLVISGGSAGGMLIGAVLNLRPDVAKAAVLWVPFVDVLNTMEDASLPLTVGEWEEWGNPLTEEQYRWIREYCPYTNLAAKGYPAMLVKTSLNDSQVMYWEPAKYVARLRTLKTDDNPLLFYTNLDAGHGGSSGRYDHLREDAFDFAFMLWQMGLAGEGG